jgi:hypothetical protein
MITLPSDSVRLDAAPAVLAAQEAVGGIERVHDMAV